MDSRDVDQVVAEMVRVLTPYASRDWQVRAGSLEWSCWTTAAHVAHDLLAYAGQVAARPGGAYLPFDLVVRADAPPREVLQVVIASGGLLSCAVAAGGPDARAWHWGATDPGGFAALGVNEALVHTYDIAQGLGISWLPPASPCAGVLARLVPRRSGRGPGPGAAVVHRTGGARRPTSCHVLGRAGGHLMARRLGCPIWPLEVAAVGPPVRDTEAPACRRC